MKNIKILLSLCIICLGFSLISCTDTKDCVCTVEIPSKKAQLKATQAATLYDWDGKCSDITASDIKGWNGDPCVEK